MTPQSTQMFCRLGLAVSTSVFTFMNLVDLLTGPRPNTLISIYLTITGLAFLSCETLPLTAETSVFIHFPFLKNPKGRIITYLIVAAPMFLGSSRASTTFAAISLVFAAVVNAVSLYPMRVLSSFSSSCKTTCLTTQNHLEERVYQGL